MVSPDFHALLKAIKNQPVLVIGDIMLDRFVYGRVERISPESPVPILAIEREESMLGGAGNALANLVGLGAKAHIVGLIGQDTEGAEIKEKINALGLKTTGLVEDPARPTIIKTRFLAGHQQLLRTDFERKHPLDEAITQALIKRTFGLIDMVKVVILSDYGKGVLSRSLIGAVVKQAKKKNIPVIVDPKSQDFSLYKGAYAVTPNKKELSAAAQNKPVGTDEEIIEASDFIIKNCGIESVIATRSAEGMSVIQKKIPPAHFRGQDIEVFDVSGAGDTVIATIGAALAAGADLQTAAALANIAGSIVVTKVGTAPIRASEIEEFTSENIARQAATASWEEAQEQIKRWKARGYKVGFTNGCFDILHFGHVSYLKEARKYCDRLIIGLNTDRSVGILKGPERPIHDENSRAAVLGSLSSVDMVVFFGAKQSGQDNTANALLRLLKPDIYFKGGDYKPEHIPEAPTVLGYGGDIKVLSSFDGHSTTNSIKKIAQS